MANKKPVIGITAAHYKEELKTFPRDYYVKSIKNAGGIPIIIPNVHSGEAEQYLDILDGLLLTGGGDISPVYLSEAPLRGIGSCIPERDQSEIILTKTALKRDLPLLGICRGIQLLAVAAGGKIYQDIPSQHPKALLHSQTAPRHEPWHEVKLIDSLLYRIMGDEKILVNSFHHQAVSQIPDQFRQNALAPDGIIEGIEKVGAKFCIGVQWHPESMEEDRYSKELFKAFVEACS